MKVRTKVNLRFPQAPQAPLPVLAEFLVPFRMQFAQAHSADNLERYVTGLLNEHPNKNCDTMASVVPGTNQQRLHHLLTEMVWDEADLNRQRVKQMLTLDSEGDGVLIFDDTGFGKQGQHSVGVARQYSGTFGKVTNCQVTVNCHYAERTLAWPVATRLYLPREWADDPVCRQQAHVPEKVQFQTKAEIALELLDEAQRLAIPHACVVVDAD
jgi:SRSO17 transposase